MCLGLYLGRGELTHDYVDRNQTMLGRVGSIRYEVFRIEWIYAKIATGSMDGPDDQKAIGQVVYGIAGRGRQLRKRL